MARAETTTGNPVGRPSEFPQTLIQAKEYLLEGKWQELGEVVPTIAGLACYCQKRRKTIYDYGEESEEFKDILDGIMRLQESLLISESLKGKFNPTITKLLLTKHGYSDRIEQEINAKIDAPSLNTFYAIDPTKPESES